MKPFFEELDYRETPFGAISLRRRAEVRLEGVMVYEVKLGDEFLMSSLFTESEIQLAKLGLAALQDAGHTQDLTVIVGGLGLGYTAATVLDNANVRSLSVIEIMRPVIDWHQQGLVPLGNRLAADTRCELVEADFFELAVADGGFGGQENGKPVHAVLLDIDHSPAHWLNQDNRSFYTPDALGKLADKLLPGGVFGIWSNDSPDAGFTGRLDMAFHSSTVHVIRFPNPYTGGTSSCTVYLARKQVFGQGSAA